MDTTPIHQDRPPFRLTKTLQFWFYLAYGVLFLSGVFWLYVGSTQDDSATPPFADWQPFWLKIHGAAAMPVLVILGVLIPVHMQRAWKSGKNRATGLCMIAINAVLILTAWGLYYGGDEKTHVWISKIHIAIGLAFPLVLLFHIWVGRKK